MNAGLGGEAESGADIILGVGAEFGVEAELVVEAKFGVEAVLGVDAELGVALPSISSNSFSSLRILFFFDASDSTFTSTSTISISKLASNK